MLALAMHQPWASLYVRGVKRNETRSWATDHRGPLVIHAAKHLQITHLEPRLLRILEREFGQDWPDKLPRGALIGMVDIVACVVTEAVPLTSWDADDHACGDFSCGRYAWRAENPRPFPTPIPWRGSQTFFRVPLDILPFAPPPAPHPPCLWCGSTGAHAATCALASSRAATA
jgi:activating signal cointegrator 1